MKDIGTTMLLTGLILAAATVIHYWLQDKWRQFQRGVNSCACGLYDLTDIEGQKTSVAIHRRDLCAPLREMML